MHRSGWNGAARRAWTVACRAGGDLAALFWPGPCLVCGGDLPARQCAGVCAACWCKLPRRREPLDAVPGCRAIVAPFAYAGATTVLHRQLKFSAHRALAAPLSARMAAACRHECDDLPQIIVPVPRDPLRVLPRRRAAEWLARGVARRLGIPCDGHALSKVETTPAQKNLSAARRRHVLLRSFRARPDRVAGRRILAVDDVVTTGATVAETARALRESGARDVVFLALAHTPRSLAPDGGQS